MKIIQKQDTLLHYSIDPYYFETHNEVDRSYTTQSNWRRAENDTFILAYGISYSAFDKATGDHFVKYERRLMLHCLIDDIAIDNFDILKIKEEMHISAGQFIEQNSMSFFSRLKFPAIDFSEARAIREKEAFLEMTKGKVPFEQKSETQKDFEETFDRNLLTVKVEVK
jgi:hypothetical protein